MRTCSDEAECRPSILTDSARRVRTDCACGMGSRGRQRWIMHEMASRWRALMRVGFNCPVCVVRLTVL